MDWSTSALIHNSPLARRLPGQRTPPDPTIQQVHAADLTYGWHTESSHGSETESENIDDDDEEEEEGEAAAAEGSTGAMTRQQEAARALRQRRRERRATRRRLSNSSASSSSEGSIVSYNSATAGEKEADEKVADEGENLPTSRTDGGTQAGNGNSSEHDADSFICRICFDGPGSEDEGGETLGKLIAPCRCRGTMKFVHQACLTRWRALSMRQSSIMACDQCGSPYKFRKSRFVGLATSRWLTLLVSCLLFTALIWSVGFTAETIVRRWDDPAQAVESKSAAKTSTRSRIWQSIFGEDEDHSAHSFGEYDDDDDVYAYGYGYVSTFYVEPVYYYRLVKAAVKHVGSGRATKAVKDLVVQRDSTKSIVPLQEKKMGWFAALLDDWKYGSGGLWEGQRPSSVHSSETSISTGEKEGRDGNSGDAHSIEASSRRERYDALTASELQSGEKPKRNQKTKIQQEELILESSSWWDRLTMQFSLGFSLVGIFSFINLLLGVSFWGPFHLGNFGLGRSFARLTGGGRRRGGGGGGGGGGDGGTIASVILLFLVIIGIIKALLAVISFTNYLSKRVLTRVEDYIIEYSSEELDQDSSTRANAGEPQQQQRRRWWFG